MVIKPTMSRRIFMFFNIIFMLILVVIMLYPFLNMLAITFSDGVSVLTGKVNILPKNFTLSNYQVVLNSDNIWNSFGVSVAKTVLGTVAQLTITSLAAYALSKKTLPGRSAFIMYLYIPSVISGGMIPSFIVVRSLGLMNSFWVYIIPSLFGFFNMILLRTYFEGLPHSLEESARVDGASNMRIFFNIVLPLSKPVLATVSLYIAVGQWNDWFTTALYNFQNEKLWPLQYILQQILQQSSMAQKLADEMAGAGYSSVEIEAIQTAITPRSIQYTVLMVATIPIIVVYPLLQKYFVKGVMVGAIKS